VQRELSDGESARTAPGADCVDPLNDLRNLGIVADAASPSTGAGKRHRRLRASVNRGGAQTGGVADPAVRDSL